jgi:hypothetical protein
MPTLVPHQAQSAGVPDVSYDIQIWSVHPVRLAETLPEVDKWRPEGDGWAYDSRDWQIIVGDSVEVLIEDIPEDVFGLVPGIRYLNELNLEPVGASRRAYKLLGSVSRRLGRAAHGVVLDPQTDTIATPTGVKRYRPQRRSERFSILAFSWWFTDGPLLTRSGLERFLGLLERLLPEAMPRRYGLLELPQHQYSETGKDHFLDFLHQHLDGSLVWYPHWPVVGVSMSCSPEWGISRQDFRANHVKVHVEAKALEQPGWHVALDTFWRAASQAICPFYGDVRTLGGFLRMGAPYALDMATEFHPVKGSWWVGIPRTAGHAIVLGEPYLDLWPSFAEAEQLVDGLVFLATNDWKTPDDVSDLVGGVLDELAQRWVPKWTATPYGGRTINWNTEFPPQWLFEHAGRA